MPVFTDVAHGALAPGVNGATLLVFNVAAGGAALALTALLATPAGQAVWPHVAAALAVNVGLAVGVNWIVAAGGGLVSADTQRAALFGEPQPADQTPPTSTTSKDD